MVHVLLVAFSLGMWSCPLRSADANVAIASRHADVVAMVGTASCWTSTNSPLPLRRGASLAEGLVIRTGPDSALDLSLEKLAGIARLAENTTVVLEKLPHDEAEAIAPVHVRLNLLEGTLLGIGNTLPLTERYEVKTPTGIAGIGASEFRIDARGYIVVLSGKVLFAFVPPGKQPVVHTLQAPPPVYFSPHEGVRPAPGALEREVRAQCLPKLRPR